MTLKDKLKQLETEWTSLLGKIKTKLQQKDQTITDTITQLQESNRKLELQNKENSENEKVLEKLIKEFTELAKELE